MASSVVVMSVVVGGAVVVTILCRPLPIATDVAAGALGVVASPGMALATALPLSGRLNRTRPRLEAAFCDSSVWKASSFSTTGGSTSSELAAATTAGAAVVAATGGETRALVLIFGRIF